MLKVFFLLLGFSITLLASSLPATSVVHINASVSSPNYQYPWQTGKIENISGSGVIIEGNYILTSAHVIANAKFIQVSKENSTQRQTAVVKFVSPQSDLALLEVENKLFFTNTKPLKITTNVKQGDAITVLGFPIGGATLSTTKGVISRIEQTQYVTSQETLLAFQIDAAINLGNSGGPAINAKSEIVGIAMQVLTKANNIAYIIPSVIINSFLEDCKDGKVDGFDTTRTAIQPLINQALREYYHLRSNQEGIVITRLDENEHELHLGDILLEIDHQKVFNNATVQTPYGLLDYRYLFTTKPVGSTLALSILRDKKLMKLNYTLKYKYNIAKEEFNTMPRYLIYGGFIFAPLSFNYIAASPYNYMKSEVFFSDLDKAKQVKEPVIIQFEMLPHAINVGYQSKGEFVKSVNGLDVIDFKHFVELIDEANTPTITIEFLGENCTKIILNTVAAKQSFEDIKKIYGIRSDRRL